MSATCQAPTTHCGRPGLVVCETRHRRTQRTTGVHLLLLPDEDVADAVGAWPHAGASAAMLLCPHHALAFAAGALRLAYPEEEL